MTPAATRELPAEREQRRPPIPADNRAPRSMRLSGARRAGPVVKRAAVAFYDDQMTQHAGALTYYALMSLFPALLLSLSVLGLFGEYPRTYDAIVDGLGGVVPATILDTLDSSIEHAVERRGAAATALVVSVLVGFYGITGVLESARRALNVVFDVECGRGFLRRKAVDVFSAIVLMALIGLTLVLMFIGGGAVGRLLGPEAAQLWTVARWPAALFVAMLVFAWLYFVTADRRHRRFRLFTPGAVVGVVAWLGLSAAFAQYVMSFPEISALYGAFAAAILVVFWLWMTGVCLLFGAELDASFERERRAASAG
jgi:membrane protein